MQKEESKKESVKLLFCPFCGGEAEIRTTLLKCNEKFTVACINRACPASIGYYRNTLEEAIYSWNTRKPMEAVVVELNETGRKFCENVGCSKECENCEHGALMRTIIEIVRGKE